MAKNKVMLEKYRSKNPIAVLSLLNCGGIEILDIEYGIDDYVISAINNAGDRSSIGKHKIYTSTSGRTYFRFGDRRYYIDEFIRTNI